MGFFEDLRDGVKRAMGNNTGDALVSYATLGLVKDFSGENARGNALAAQTEAANRSSEAASVALEEQKKELEPWKQGGLAALGRLNSGNVFGDGGYQSDPGYAFRLAEGNKAIEAAASARGRHGGGATMKELARYASDYASGEYNNAYNRQYNRLSQLAGFGNQASTNMGNFYGGHAATVGQNAIGVGNAQAASEMAGYNRNTQLVNSGIGAAATYYGSGGGKPSVKMSQLRNSQFDSWTPYNTDKIGNNISMKNLAYGRKY